MIEQLEEKVEVDEKQLHCDGHAGADGPHHDAQEETGRGEDAHDAQNFLCFNTFRPQHFSILSPNFCFI